MQFVLSITKSRSDTGISTIDIDAVIILAIQTLEKRNAVQSLCINK
jgi:hypothetical protein